MKSDTKLILKLINLRLQELKEMDESEKIRDVPRSKWKDEEIKNKTLLWQIKPKTTKILFNIIQKNQPKTILELGTSAGYSTLIMAKATLKTKSKIHTVECSSYRIKLAKETFKKTNTTNQIKLHEDKIINVLNNWNPKKKIDFLFLDADKEKYFEYIKIIIPALSKNAIMIADNVLDNPKKTCEFIQFMKDQKNFKTTIKKTENGILIAKKIIK